MPGRLDHRQDLRGLSPIVEPGAFEVHDLDMDAAGPGDVDRFLDRCDDVVRLVPEVGEIAGIAAFEHVTQRHHLGALGITAGRCEQPGREAERAGREPFFEQSRHVLELGRARRTCFHAHHVKPQGVMTDQHAGVDRGLRKAVEILGKRGFAKRQPGRAGAEVILDQLPLAGKDGCHREPAMPDDLGRHTLPHLAFGLGVDRQGEIRVGLDVDKARRHRQTLGVDRPGRLCGERSP